MVNITKVVTCSNHRTTIHMSTLGSRRVNCGDILHLIDVETTFVFRGLALKFMHIIQGIMFRLFGGVSGSWNRVMKDGKSLDIKVFNNM